MSRRLSYWRATWPILRQDWMKRGTRAMLSDFLQMKEVRWSADAAQRGDGVCKSTQLEFIDSYSLFFMSVRIYLHRFRGWLRGVDEFGQRYYENPHATSGHTRWVIYPNRKHFDPANIPPEWHMWIHATVDETPDQVWA